MLVAGCSSSSRAYYVCVMPITFGVWFEKLVSYACRDFVDDFLFCYSISHIKLLFDRKVKHDAWTWPLGCRWRHHLCEHFSSYFVQTRTHQLTHTHKKYRVYLIIPPMVEWILIGFSSVCIRTGQTCSVYAMHSMFGTHFIQCTVLVLFFYFSIKFRHCFWAHIWMHFYLFARSSFWCVVYNGN